ncbi:MAG TPA: hypothetical protein VIV60_19640 [Polyangiaceae bacterium]
MLKLVRSSVSTHKAISAFLGLCIVITTWSCKRDSNDAVGGCTVGATNTCRSPTGCNGVQQCQSDGTWNTCDCSSADDLPVLGGACVSNGECPEGATCLLPDGDAWFSGGPPSGLCVADCTGNPDACQAFRNGICISAARSGTNNKHALCMPTCDLTQGNSETPACSAIPHCACEPIESGQAGFCRPFCLFDSQCPSGYCDRQAGVCVSAPPPTHAAGFGESCTPNATDCDGVCRSVSNDLALCSYRCIFGTSDECAVEGSSPVVGVCAYSGSDIAPGNLGYCAPLCSCNDDCIAAGYRCRAFVNENTQLAYGKTGICVPLAALGDSKDGIPCGTEGS